MTRHSKRVGNSFVLLIYWPLKIENKTMKQLTLLIASFFILSQVTSQDAGSNDPWMAYMTPAPFHKMLEKYTGEWKMDVSMWMEGAGEPMKSTMKSTHAMISNGLFLEMNQLGDMMGTAFTARITIGYNNSSKEVELTSYTNMGSGMTFLRGKWDESKKAADLKGQLTDPVSGKAINIRQVVSFPDATTMLIENFDQSGTGPEKKTMEFRCTKS
ncbi:MAG: DUF1579 domain-containing protein [Chitinophagaceae bacterium]|nr:MAG: DUF1579 domain-containing protein [Chitinophagaceae bacterium]